MKLYRRFPIHHTAPKFLTGNGFVNGNPELNPRPASFAVFSVIGFRRRTPPMRSPIPDCGYGLCRSPGPPRTRAKSAARKCGGSARRKLSLFPDARVPASWVPDFRVRSPSAAAPGAVPTSRRRIAADGLPAVQQSPPHSAARRRPSFPRYGPSIPAFVLHHYCVDPVRTQPKSAKSVLMGTDFVLHARLLLPQSRKAGPIPEKFLKEILLLL